MAGFSSRDDIINEITTNGKQDTWNFFKIGTTAQGAGSWHTLWKAVGNPGAGANPAASTGTAYSTDAGTSTAGAIWFPDRAADQRYLMSFGACATQNCTLMLYDRLVGVSGIALTSTGNKTVNSVAISDHYTGTSASLNEVWLETTTASTTTAAVVDLNQYTSADGTTGTTGGSYTMPATATVADSMHQMPLSATKQGVRSVEVGLHVGTATTNQVVTLVILRPLAKIPLLANVWNEISFLDDSMGLPRIYDNSTLALAYLATATTATNFWGTVNTAYG